MPGAPHPQVEIAAVVGNGRLLAGFDATGRLRTLTAPHLDYPQHIRWSRLGLKLPLRRGGVRWLDGAAWQHEQTYVPGTNVLMTRSVQRPRGLAVEQRAAAVEDVLVAGIHLRRAPHAPEAVLVWELGLQVGGQPQANALTYLPQTDVFAAYHRDLAVALATVPAARVRARPAGALGWAESGPGGRAFTVVGEVTARLEIALRVGQLALLMIAVASPPQAAAALDAVRRRFSEGVAWPADLAPVARQVPLAAAGFGIRRLGPLQSTARECYRRSLLTVAQLQDRSGAFLAGPPIDARYLHSGGYAYCWPRDGAFIAHALDVAGEPGAARAFFQWALAHQPEDGIWKQRYYADGAIAPCWAMHQLDETGTVLWALDRHLRLSPDAELLEAGLAAAGRAFEGISHLAVESGWPPSTENLWEDQQGSHLYTLAALLAGAEAWLERAQALTRAGVVPLLRTAQARLREVLSGWPTDARTGALARALVRTDRPATPLPDFTPDASLLGLSVPFALLEPHDRRLAATVNAVVRALAGPQQRIRRYQHDGYRGGNPWPLCSLWLAWHYLRAGNPKAAVRLYRQVLLDRTEAGLLSEQVDARTGRALWVVPLPWAHAWFLLVTHAFVESGPA